MLKIKLLTGLVLLSMLAFTLGACAPQPLPTPSPAPAPQPSPAPTPTPSPAPTPTQPPAPSPAPPIVKEGVNFQFLISDDVNAIADFEHVYVTISEIGVQRGGESGNWLEFTPDITEVDLKPLVGENALEIWSGNLTPGEYSKVFLYVSEVNGILTEALGGGKANVKLPSEKLQISKPFVISENTTTSFVYDVTVVKAGQSGQYILQPQIAQSGAEQQFREVKQEKKEKDEEPETQESEDIEEEDEDEGEEESGEEVSLEVSCEEFQSENHISHEIEVPVGGMLVVTLCSNPTTGFQWSETAEISDTAVLEQVSHEFIPPQGTAQTGAAGKEVWTFKALSEGDSTVSFEYSRPWEGGEKGEWTFELAVEVE